MGGMGCALHADFAGAIRTQAIDPDSCPLLLRLSLTRSVTREPTAVGPSETIRSSRKTAGAPSAK
jgi:hypothetical protein